MQIQILASGSSGNATIVRDGESVVLLDAGISMRRIRLGLESMGLAYDDVDAVVLTHDHSDHVSGLKMIRKHHGRIPILASRGTADAIGLGRGARTVRAGEAFEVGGLTFHPYPVSHDASEPLGYRFESSGGVTVGWATDLGEWNEQVAEHLEGCDMVMIEANHDVRMLARGPYPAFLKRRVASRLGHLSNAQARALLDRVASPRLSVVALGHLSGSNNTPEAAAATVGEALRGASVHLTVAPRKSASRLLELPGDYPAHVPEPPLQAELF
jgi:phosphoribosyl 1,2-cyclic phosphodiesterase